jgi:2-methylisocitrate lyase-like PEP mutase family enzyme
MRKDRDIKESLSEGGHDMVDKARSLRELLKKEKVVIIPGVFDALTAKVAEYCDFSVIYMTGYGTAALYGYPDFGLLTMSEMVENVRRISDASSLPLIADADTGYGNPLNVYRTVREYERAGAAAIQLEDQTWPKRCGHMDGKMVIDAEEMVAKVKAAADARENLDTILVIRTDAIATHSFEEAIRRGQMYAEAGADIIFVEGPTREQMRQIPLHFLKPCLLNIPFPDRDVGVKKAEEWGFRLVLYPLVTLLGTIGGSLRMCRRLLEEGKLGEPDIPFSFLELHQFLGLDKFKRLENTYKNGVQKQDR